MSTLIMEWLFVLWTESFYAYPWAMGSYCVLFIKKTICGATDRRALAPWSWHDSLSAISWDNVRTTSNSLREQGAHSYTSLNQDPTVGLQYTWRKYPIKHRIRQMGIVSTCRVYFITRWRLRARKRLGASERPTRLRRSLQRNTRIVST